MRDKSALSAKDASTASAELREAERYLLSLELFGMRFGLERMQRLMTVLDSPQERFETIHVLGTNGKSSTARMIAAILEQHGARTGAYLSPHLTSFAERIEVRGRHITPERFAAAVERAARAAATVNKTLAADDRVTQFEALTAAAYWELGRAQTGVAVVEAGLGGRYDATSVIDANVHVLTNVGLEHTRWLGPTERHIAEEKLAVVSRGGELVCGPLGEEALAVARQVTGKYDANLQRLGVDFDLLDAGARTFTVRTGRELYEEIELRPLGRFQRRNFAVAIAAAETYRGTLDPATVRDAAASLTLPGRLEIVGEEPLVIFDGAHNPSGMRALVESLDGVVGDRKLTVVVSILDDKDAAAMLAVLLPRCARVVFTRCDNPRVLSPATLKSLARQLGGPVAEVEAEPSAALELAVRRSSPRKDAVLVTGSIYLLSQLVQARVDATAVA